jgi:hypothetical protein
MLAKPSQRIAGRLSARFSTAALPRISDEELLAHLKAAPIPAMFGFVAALSSAPMYVSILVTCENRLSAVSAFGRILSSMWTCASLNLGLLSQNIFTCNFCPLFLRLCCFSMITLCRALHFRPNAINLTQIQNIR